MTRKELKKAEREFRSWIERCTLHCEAIDSSDEPMTELEEMYGSELADDVDELIENTQALGREGQKLARTFAGVAETWKQTGRPPVAILDDFARAADLR